MEIAQALVLSSAARPDQPWASVRSTPKPLVPVANRPLLFHDLDALRAAGVRETTIAVEPGTAGVIRDAVGDGEDWRMTVRYAECAPHAPVAEALARSRDLMAHEPVLVRRAGTVLREGIHPHIAAFADERLDALALRTPGLPDGDRPGAPHDGSMMLSRRAVSILTDGASDHDPLARIAAGGGHVRVQEVDGCLPCLGRQDSLLEANRRVLAELTPSVAAEALLDSRVQGPVVIHPTAHVERSLVRGPAIIGPRARIVDSYVGPSTSIGADVELEGAEVEYSIVLPGARLAFLGRRLEASVIGRGAQVRRSLTPPASLRLAVGEGAEIVLS
ncbi:MAG TPA: NDP-sugar synthase [Baekduia sp.]|uniref:NDP-sugar synthase n=1 Tax=Baekduia sp. TaxID=2600305 RepID=UPI002D78F88E|nr:NDP-sugar synthase [Baekduia sp.]HET6508240.1 NDP-sugar synthase [Baekduia sp.]